jgi:broad specificity phosphatase PhoE
MSTLVVRHARAGSRRHWDGPDEKRPLSGRGRRQAGALVNLLAPFAPARALSSPYVRCVETVEPLGEKLGVPIEPSDALAEGAPADDVVALARSLTGSTVVLCSHGDVIYALLDALARDEGLKLPKHYESAKGSTWVLHARKGRFASATYLPAPP